MNIIRLLKVLSAVSIILTAASAQTGTLQVYFSPPAAQSTTVSGVATETFDQLATGIWTTTHVSTAGIGTYTGSSTNPFGIMASDVYGGATDSGHTSPTNYLGLGNDSNSVNPVYLTLTNPASYFGFWWSAGDQYNRVDLYQGSTLYATFSTQDLLTFLNNGTGNITALNGTQYATSAYFGNPNITSGSKDSTEPFVYVSFVITGASIDKLAFYNLSTASAFESDNHSVIFTGSTVTIPTTFVSVETLALTPTVATPTFSPVAGTYTSVQTVAITSATSGASIRYTTNGSTPSETAGTPYSGPVTVSSTETINAIAYETGMSDSVVAAASYTINLPAVSAISPTSGQQGQVLTGVQITGQFTHFAAGSAVSFSNTGVTAGSITVTDATHLTATVTIAAGATTGASSVTVTTGSEVATGSNLFTVSSGTASVSTISSTTGQQGQVLTGVQITGQFTHFAAGSAVSFSNAGVTASSITVTDATHLTATVTIAAGASTGVSSVTVTTGSEVATASNLFTVSSGTAAVSAIRPTSGQQGQVLTGVQITGQFTHFAAGSAVSFSNTGVTASSITVTDATHLTATVTIAAGATAGAFSVTVTTGSEVATGSNLFTVSSGTALISTISSTTGQQGQVLTGV